MKSILPFILVFIVLYSCGNKSASTNNEPITTTDSTFLLLDDSIKKELHTSFCYGKFEFCLNKITSNEFDSLFVKHNKVYKPKKIKDFDKARDLLADCVEWSNSNEGQTALKLKFRNGRERSFDSEDSAPFFVAYFPDLDILELEWGHSQQLCINMSSGCDESEMGDPSVTYPSPNEKLGVTTFYNGQDVDDYFIYRKDGMEYSHLIGISPTLIKQLNFWVIRSGFWTNNEMFYAKVESLKDSENDTQPKYLYYKLIIKPFERTTVPDYLKITSQKVGFVAVNDDIKKLSYTYTIVEDKIYREGDEHPFYRIENEGIELHPKFDNVEWKFISTISEIIVKNGKYATNQLIGAGSTIDELQKAYPDIKFSYSYIGGTFCAESATLGAIQFEFNEKDFINTSIDLMAGDSVELSASDFKSSAMVKSIRIY